MPRTAKELTAQAVKTLGEGTHAVGGVPGVVLQVRGISRVFLLRVTVAEKRHNIGIGPTHTLSLGQARDRARELRAQILAGINPLHEKRKARADAATAQLRQITFAKAAQDYIKSQGSALGAKSVGQWESSLAMWVEPIIGKVEVEAISTADVLRVLQQPVDKGTFWTQRTETASRVRQRIERIIGAADIAAGRERMNPARLDVIEAVLPAVGKIKVVEHHKALPWGDVPAFMARLRTQAGMGARALEFAVLTAARSGEVRGMVWGEVDTSNRLWTIPGERMKAGKEHRVPLTDAALALLIAMKGSTEPDSDALVFPSTKDTALSDMTLAAVLRRMKVDATVHGFRSSFRDWAGESTHHPREVIEHALAHQLKDKAEAAYQRGDLLTKRSVLMADWAVFCASNADS